jgi:hypothetical protein
MSRRTFLADDEFDQVQELARSLQRPITTCPTCQTKQSTLDKDPDYKPTYRLFGKEYDCDCKQQITLFTHYLRAGIPEEYMRLDWTTYNGSGRDFVDGYLGNWRGYWKHGFGVEFGGRTMGIGKTFCACHIGKELLKQGQKVYFTPFVEMVAAFEKENGHELEDLEDHYPRTYSLLAAKQVRIDMDGNDYRHNSGLENMELALNDEVRPIT